MSMVKEEIFSHMDAGDEGVKGKHKKAPLGSRRLQKERTILYDYRERKRISSFAAQKGGGGQKEKGGKTPRCPPCALEKGPSVRIAISIEGRRELGFLPSHSRKGEDGKPRGKKQPPPLNPRPKQPPPKKIEGCVPPHFFFHPLGEGFPEKHKEGVPLSQTPFSPPGSPPPKNGPRGEHRRGPSHNSPKNPRGPPPGPKPLPGRKIFVPQEKTPGELGCSYAVTMKRPSLLLP